MCPTQHDFDKNIAATRRLYVHIVGIYTYKIMYIHIYTYICSHIGMYIYIHIYQFIRLLQTYLHPIGLITIRLGSISAADKIFTRKHFFLFPMLVSAISTDGVCLKILGDLKQQLFKLINRCWWENIKPSGVFVCCLHLFFDVHGVFWNILRQNPLIPILLGGFNPYEK